MRNLFAAMLAWRTMFKLIRIVEAKVDPRIGKAAVEGAIDRWYMECEKLLPPQKPFFIVRKKVRRP